MHLHEYVYLTWNGSLGLTVTLMTELLREDVVTSQAMIPAQKPETAPAMQPHLFAFFQLTHKAIGTTAEPRTTPMNSCQLLSFMT